MDSASGGAEKDAGGENESAALGAGNLHDHSDLLIPNPSFISSPASVSSSMMSITSPTSLNSDNDLHKQGMDFQVTSPEENNLEGGIPLHLDLSQPESSPPNVIVDDSPLQPSIDRNKQSLKVKLLMRRPMNQLVEQGILPPPKTPAAFAGQRVRLERARMGDLLKAKIQQRPARQELIRQHILEDTDSRVAPSLAEKQRMLKRARLADSLNDHLIHRPGPLELVQKNILHALDADMEKAIKEGSVSFKATSEGHVPGPSLPSKYTVNEDDSSSDISSPAGTPDASSSGHNTEANTPISKQLSDSAISLPSPSPSTIQSESSPGEVILKTTRSESAPVVTPTPRLILATPKSLGAQQAQQLAQAAAIFQVTPATATVIPPPPPLPTTSATIATIPPPPPLPQTIVLSDEGLRDLFPQLQSAAFKLAPARVQTPAPSQLPSSSSSFKSRSSKKNSKSKSQPKARAIKFHEYKGPSSSQQKGGSSSNGTSSTLTEKSKAESSYELLLKQQQLFLQWQLEWQHKYPQILLPAAPKVTGVSQAATLTGSGNKATLSSFPVTTIPATLINTQLISSSNNQQSSSQQCTPPTTMITLAPKLTDIAPKPPEVNAEAKNGQNETLEKSVSNLNLSNISDWKVSDLKAELKKRNLPVSGSKSQLVERLKTAVSKDNNGNETQPAPIKMEVVAPTDENSNEAMMDVSSGTNDEETGAVQFNGVPISLQNILNVLMTNNNNQTTDNLKNINAAGGTPKDSKNGGPQKHRLVLQQHIQQKLQQQAIQNQLQTLIQKKQLLQQQQQLQEQQQNQNRAEPQLIFQRMDLGNQWLPEQTNKAPASTSVEVKSEADLVKSQMVDDVLEILIRNGELPASAAQPSNSTNGIPVPSGTTSTVPSSSTGQAPPPPPPLPPPTFSVMLPTTIPFSRHQDTRDFRICGPSTNTPINGTVDSMDIGFGDAETSHSAINHFTSPLNHTSPFDPQHNNFMTDDEDLDWTEWLDTLLPASEPQLSESTNPSAPDLPLQHQHLQHPDASSSLNSGPNQRDPLLSNFMFSSNSTASLMDFDELNSHNVITDMPSSMNDEFYFDMLK